MTNTEWIAIAAVAATLVIGIGGWFFLRPKQDKPGNQTQTIKGGKGYQAGGDINVND